MGILFFGVASVWNPPPAPNTVHARKDHGKELQSLSTLKHASALLLMTDLQPPPFFFLSPPLTLNITRHVQGPDCKYCAPLSCHHDSNADHGADENCCRIRFLWQNITCIFFKYIFLKIIPPEV